MNLLKSTLLVAGTLSALSGCARAQDEIASPTVSSPANEIAALTDEFNDKATASKWQRVEQVEGWNNNQLEIFDINTIYKGKCAMMPYTSSWYQDWRGVLLFKPVKGDFVMTTRVKVTGRDGKSAPRVPFSLAGLMVRIPRHITPKTWQPGGENYVFISLGVSTNPGVYSFEYKTTINSVSHLKTVDSHTSEAQLQVARIGNAAIVLVKAPQSPWRIMERFDRPDFPAELQAGMTVYTDWPGVEKTPPLKHNSTVLYNGNPDLGALFDYVRYTVPRVPQPLQGRNLTDPNAVSDAELLEFLGEAATNSDEHPTADGNGTPAPGFATGAAK